MKSKKLLIISTHSFVDLITNSSSELFVCDSDKSLETIKEVLATLLRNHDNIEGETHSFDDVFGTIMTSQYSFQWWDVPQAISEEYTYYHRYCLFGRNNGYSVSDDISIEEKKLGRLERELEAKHNVHEKNLYEQNKDEYNRRWKNCRVDVDILWTDFGSRTLKSDGALFIEFLKQNQFASKQRTKVQQTFDTEIADHIAKKRGKHPHFHGKFNKSILDAYEVFREWSSWGITANKGDVLIYSANDNSIPYQLIDTITAYLNAQRYHLG